MTKNYLKLEQISEKYRDLHDGYTERNITYVCPCGNGTILWSKERPNGVNGATFSDVFCYCDDCCKWRL